jgi:gamma-glutamylcyclotransferase (GGCT)/AIG2-like uncharacterized protein YtfP
MDELVAFYGTLMSGLPSRPERPDLRPHVRVVSDCLIPGALFDVGPYPALLEGDGVVRGELWRTTSAEALGVLDAWEGYASADEPGSEYLRRWVLLVEPKLSAWVYVWNRAADGAHAIAEGDWRAHVRRNASGAEAVSQAAAEPRCRGRGRPARHV